MKVVFCAFLVTLVESAPTIVENVKQQEYNQPRAYSSPMDYNQFLDYNQRLEHNQRVDYSQPLDNFQRVTSNQPLDYSQVLDYNQRLEHNQRLDYLRGRRSNQLAVVSPCAAAAMHAQGYSPYYSHGYASPYGYPYMHPGHVYRTDEEPEMSFSDAEQSENTARSLGYEAPSGLAYGVFPNANTGGCGLPILVSCSPNVVQGRLVKAEPHSYSTPVNYRLTEHPVVQDHPSADHETKSRAPSE